MNLNFLTSKSNRLVELVYRGEVWVEPSSVRHIVNHQNCHGSPLSSSRTIYIVLRSIKYVVKDVLLQRRPIVTVHLSIVKVACWASSIYIIAIDVSLSFEAISRGAFNIAIIYPLIKRFNSSNYLLEVLLRKFFRST